MGRSVSVPSNAALIAYDVWDGEDDSDGFEFDWLLDDLRSRMAAIAPSMRHQSCFIGREDHVIASNGHASFGVSEYCGLLSIWIVPNEDSPLAQAWIDKIAPRFYSAFGQLRRVGQFSNGEAVFERVGA